MTPEQARAAHNAYDRLYHYLSADAVPHMASEAELENAIFGNFLATDTLLVILARLRGKTFDQVLAALPERDEGHPPGPGARYTWETAAHQLRYMAVPSMLSLADEAIVAVAVCANLSLTFRMLAMTDGYEASYPGSPHEWMDKGQDPAVRSLRRRRRRQPH